MWLKKLRAYVLPTEKKSLLTVKNCTFTLVNLFKYPQHGVTYLSYTYVTHTLTRTDNLVSSRASYYNSYYTYIHNLPLFHTYNRNTYVTPRYPSKCIFLYFYFLILLIIIFSYLLLLSFIESIYHSIYHCKFLTI